MTDPEHCAGDEDGLGAARGIAVALALVAFLALTSCDWFRIPVTIHPPHDAQDQPIPHPTAPTGEVVDHGDGTATLNPDLRQPTPDDHPRPPQVDWSRFIQWAVGLLLGGAGVGIPLLRYAGKAKTALRIAAQLVDVTAAAETDEQVADAKRAAQLAQEAAGVRKLTQRVRGKR